MRLRSRRPRVLLAVCVGVSVVETLFVASFLPASSLALATQASAPPPFDLFHDLRWIVVYHESWLGFALELLALLVVRSAVLTLVVRAAWPLDVTLEPIAATARRSAIYVVVVSLLLAPWVGLMFAMAVVSLSWMFFVAVPVVLMLSVLVAGGAIDGSWWRRVVSRRVVGIVVLGFVAITGFGSVLATCPSWLQLPVAALAGLVNAWLWVQLVDAVLHAPVTTWRVPVVPVGVAGVFAVVIVGTVAGFALARHPVARLVAPPAGAATEWRPSTAVGRATPLLVVTGFNTEWDGVAKQAVRLDVPQRRFSYRGMADGHPQPYRRDDTHRSLRHLAHELAAQVDAYHRVTHRPVTLVAESEGALLAKAYLAGTPHAPIDHLVVVSPLIDLGRVYYPPADAEGWGVFGKLEMEGLSWALSGLSPVDVTPDTPFLRSIVDDAPAFHELMTCPLPGIRQAAILPLDTGVAAPAPRRIGIPYVVVPHFHGGMLDDAATAKVVRQVLDGRPLDDAAGWSFTEGVVQAGASAWQVPSLAADVNDAWVDEPGGHGCGAVRTHLRAWLRAG
jgi:hypothetical protein